METRSEVLYRRAPPQRHPCLGRSPSCPTELVRRDVVGLDKVLVTEPESGLLKASHPGLVHWKRGYQSCSSSLGGDKNRWVFRMNDNAICQPEKAVMPVNGYCATSASTFKEGRRKAEGRLRGDLKDWQTEL